MNAELPWNTKLLIFMSEILGRGLLVGAHPGRAAGARAGLFRRWRNSQPSLARSLGDTIILKPPRHRRAGRARSRSPALPSRCPPCSSSGVQLLQALDIVRSLLGNVVLEKVVSEARDNIREGQGIAPALKLSGQFPPLVTHMIAVGERSGQLERMLTDVADAYDREVNTALERMTALLEPLMIVLMGGSVGFIIFSIMQPIMMLNEMAGAQ